MAYLFSQYVSKENKGLCLYEIYLLGGWDNNHGKCDVFSEDVIGGMWVRKQNPVEDRGKGSRVPLQTEGRPISAACVKGESELHTDPWRGALSGHRTAAHFFFPVENQDTMLHVFSPMWGAQVVGK